MNRAKAVLIAVDQLVNTLSGGWPDETLSSRAWRWEMSGKRAWPRKLIDAPVLLRPGALPGELRERKNRAPTAAGGQTGRGRVGEKD